MCVCVCVSVSSRPKISLPTLGGVSQCAESGVAPSRRRSTRAGRDGRAGQDGPRRANNGRLKRSRAPAPMTLLTRSVLPHVVVSCPKDFSVEIFFCFVLFLFFFVLFSGGRIHLVVLQLWRGVRFSAGLLFMFEEGDTFLSREMFRGSCFAVFPAFIARGPFCPGLVFIFEELTYIYF